MPQLDSVIILAPLQGFHKDLTRGMSSGFVFLRSTVTNLRLDRRLLVGECRHPGLLNNINQPIADRCHRQAGYGQCSALRH